MPQLTIIKSPQDYDFSRNTNYVEIETDNYTYPKNDGHRSMVYFTYLKNAVLDDTLTIDFDTHTYIYTFKAATNIALKRLAHIAAGQDPNEYITQLCNDFLSDPDVAVYFDITPYNGAIFFKAKNNGTQYDLGGVATTVAGVNIYYEPGTDDIKTLIRENYRIQIEVFGKNSVGVYEKIVSFAKEPSANKIRFDLQKYVDNFLEYDLPDFSLFHVGAPYKCTKSCRLFKLRISEIFGTPPVAQPTTMDPVIYNAMDGNVFITTPHKLLKAGFDTISARLFPAYQFGYYYNNKNFLTRQPRTKKIARDQREWLYYIFHATTVGRAYIKFNLYKANGAVTSNTALHTTIGLPVAQYDVWAFPVNGGFYAHYFLDNPDYVKMTCTVWDETTNLALSEVFTYLADDEYHAEENPIYFVNSDSGLDTTRLFGVNEWSIDFDREVVSRTLTMGDTKYDGNVKQISAEKINKFSTFSGWKTAEELRYLEELFLTPYAFVYSNLYGQQTEVPIIITSKTLMVHKTNQNLKGFVIEYYEALSSGISQARAYPII